MERVNIHDVHTCTNTYGSKELNSRRYTQIRKEGHKTQCSANLRPQNLSRMTTRVHIPFPLMSHTHNTAVEKVALQEV